MLDALQRWLQRHAPAPATPAASPSLPAADDAIAVPALGGDEPLLIDVRSPAEYRGGTLRGAVNVPLSQLEAWIPAAAPDRGRPVLLFCASGGRSAAGCHLLRQLGYAQAQNAGGLHAAATRLNLPMVTP